MRGPQILSSWPLRKLDQNPYKCSLPHQEEARGTYSMSITYSWYHEVCQTGRRSLPNWIRARQSSHNCKTILWLHSLENPCRFAIMVLFNTERHEWGAAKFSARRCRKHFIQRKMQVTFKRTMAALTLPTRSENIKDRTRTLATWISISAFHVHSHALHYSGET